MYSKGDCWNGGGLFRSNSTYWLNGGCGHDLIRNSREVQPDLKYRPTQFYGGECPGVYYVRLQRDGWALKDHLDAGVTDRMAIFEKPAPGGWILRKYVNGTVLQSGLIHTSEIRCVPRCSES